MSFNLICFEKLDFRSESENANLGSSSSPLCVYTVESRYLELGYLEQLAISNRFHFPSFSYRA